MGEVLNGDCLEVMRTFGDGAFGAVVTDPPYGLSFMNKEWDTFGCDVRQPGDKSFKETDTPNGRSKVRYGYGSKYADSMVNFQSRMTPIFAEALRVTEDGGLLMCFGGTRTFHRMAAAIEDAGWLLTGTLAWSYGSGFPKSMDVSKAIDKKLGAERKVVGKREESTHDIRGNNYNGTVKPRIETYITEPSSDRAKEWEGWGTCLKPAWEPVIVASKGPVTPLEGQMLFYCGKASRKERQRGCEGLEGGNNHPTVKPLAVMEWLVDKTDGRVLDPFCGSGSTLVAAQNKGREFTGIDSDPRYCAIAEARLAAWR